MAKLFRVVLPVTNLDHAVRLYSGLLQLSGTRVSGGRHYFDCEGTILVCYEAAADGDDPSPQPTCHPGQFIYFSVRDLDAAHQRAVALGFTIKTGDIRKMPWGERIFWATDEFGNQISFVESGTEYLGRSPVEWEKQ